MKSADRLSFTTIQAPIHDFMISDLSGYIAQRLGVETQVIIDRTWQQREQLIDAGEIDVAWMCGLPYVVRADQAEPGLTLLAAPVMIGDRYNDQPIYFSDVIVRAEKAYRSFSDLRGAVWAYNEPGSQSGYNITRYHLATIDATNPFFGQVIAAGSHERCIKLVLGGEADAAAIDSTVLEMARERDRRISNQLRVLTTLGPSPIPPLVIARQIDPQLADRLKAALLEMHKDPHGRQVLVHAQIRRFQEVSDADYDAIRDMFRIARTIQL